MEIQDQAAPVDGGGQEAVADSAPSYATAREAVEAAFAAEDTERQDREYNRHPDGKFAPKEPGEKEPEAQAAPVEKPAVAAPAEASAPVETKPATPLDEPPARFSPDAKSAWATAPDSIKGEVRRAIGELETGIQQKNAQLEQYKSVEPYRQMAAQAGRDLGDVLQMYVQAENRLKSDPVNAVTQLMQDFGVNPVQYAQYVLNAQGVGVDETQAGANAMYQQQLQQQSNQVTQLQQQVAQLLQMQQQAEQARIENEIQSFGAERPGFNELKPLMGQLINSQMANDLASAYEMASRLRPDLIPQAPAPAMQTAPVAPVHTQPAPAPVQAAPPAPHTRKGNLSVTGSPSGGSTPASSKVPATAREAVQAAFSALA